MNINTTAESSTLRITPTTSQQTTQSTAVNPSSDKSKVSENQTEVSTRTGPSSRVDLSEAARQKQAQEQQISTSGGNNRKTNSLVSQIQEKIKELKEKIAEKKAQIEQLKNNNNLSEQVKKQRLEKLTGELAQLTSSLSDANANLLKAQQSSQQAAKPSTNLG